MNIEFSWQSHLGLLRQRNEDSWGARPLEPQVANPGPQLFAVADGMGGHPGGEVASSLAIRSVLDSADRERTQPIPEYLDRLFSLASNTIRQAGDRDPKHRDMGTTLTVLYLWGGQAWAGHIGDTRLYWIRGDEATQITRDHTMAQDLIEAGLLESKASEQHPSSHILTRCLGVCPNQQPDLLLRPLRVAAGDRLLLASDGLVKVVSPELLGSFVAGRGVQESTELLLRATLDGGAPDNVTVVLVSIREAGGQEGSGGPEAQGTPFSSAPSLEWRRGGS